MTTRRWLYALPALVGLAMVPLAAAIAAPPDGGPAGHGRPPHGPPISAAEATERMVQRVDRALYTAGATQEQRDKVLAKVREVAPKMHEQREELHGYKQELRQALVAPQIDRRQIEALRAEMVGWIDTSSEEVIDGMIAIAELLTPEQRQAIGDRMEEHDRPEGPPPPRPAGPPPGRR
jgi:Spy/CpxP family protein refolding chaperone